MDKDHTNNSNETSHEIKKSTSVNYICNLKNNIFGDIRVSIDKSVHRNISFEINSKINSTEKQ